MLQLLWHFSNIAERPCWFQGSHSNSFVFFLLAPTNLWKIFWCSAALDISNNKSLAYWEIFVVVLCWCAKEIFLAFTGRCWAPCESDPWLPEFVLLLVVSLSAWTLPWSGFDGSLYLPMILKYHPDKWRRMVG